MKRLIFALCITILAGGVALAQRGPRGPMAGVMKKLNLTADQKKSMQEIHQITAKQMIDIRSEIQKKRIDVRAAMGNDNPDRKALENLWTDLSRLEVNRKLLMFDTRQQIMKVLTPDQRKIFMEQRGMMMERGGMMNQMRGFNRGGIRGREVIKEKRIIRSGNEATDPQEKSGQEDDD
jgi:Spy/CpxP family protein refolding chaperone